MQPMQTAGESWLVRMRERATENAQEAAAQDRREQEHAERAKRIAAVRAASEVPMHYRNASLRYYADDHGAAITSAVQFAKRGFRAPGVGLFGGVGAGKTHLLCAIANAAIVCERRAVVITTAELTLRLRATFDTRDESEWSLIQKLVHTPVLIVDDLGKEQITEWSAQNLHAFFNARYNAGLPLCCSSNLSLVDLQRQRYGDLPLTVDPTAMIAVLDRIREMTGPWIEMSGPSRRRA